MKIQNRIKTAFQKRSIVFQLWVFMMFLVLLGIGFMWLALIFLFEQNYAKASLQELHDRLEPVILQLATGDLSADDRLLPYLSHMNDELMLTDQDGVILQMYSSGHPVDLTTRKDQELFSEIIKSRQEFNQLKEGVPYQYIDHFRNRVTGLELGFPVTVQGEPRFLILHNRLQTETVLKLNRRQLILVSLFLTAAAAVLSAILSRRFTRPIYAIRDTVDRLTENDFTAVPGLERKDEFGELSHSVEELGVALQRLEVLRKEVIANVSHELRSPLALISGYAEMVRDITWEDAAQREEDLNLIISESNRLSEMVSDILDYSQFQAGYRKLNLQTYDICDIVESEVFHCKKSADQHLISLEYQKPAAEVVLTVDALKISQVMRNLLNNAINHTAEGGRVLVRVEQEPEQVKISVSNPGEPIPEAERVLIWERYHRSQHQNGRHLGTGLGLSIVSTILDAHHMTYGVDCENGLNCFWFRCPLND